MAVTRTSTGAFNSSAAAFTAAFGAGATAGDLGILVVETANQALTTPTGWALVSQSVGLGSAGAAGGTKTFVYWKFVTSGDITSGVAISDSGDHQDAVLLTYSGCDPTTPVINTFFGDNAATTSVSITIAETAGSVTANDIALAIIGTDRDSATASTNSAASWANITGSNSFIVNASTATGAGGGIIINELVPSAGQTGDATFSCTITSSIYIGHILVLKAPSTGTTVDPSTGHLALTGHQSAAALQVAPSVGHLTLGGKIPTATVGASFTPTKGSLALTGHQPSSSLAIGISSSTGHLALGGKVPTVTKNFAVSATVGHLTLGGKVPAVSINFAVSASAGHLTLGGKVPTVTKNFAVGPTLGHLSFGGKIPTITIASGLAPSTGHLVLGGKVPTISRTLNPATGHIAFTGHVSSLSLQASPTIGHLQFSGGVPLVSTSSGITPLTAHLALSGNVPTVSYGAGATGHIKVYLGSFIAKPVKVWDGSAWVAKPLKTWTGSIWRATGY